MKKPRKPALTLSLSQEDIGKLTVQAAKLGHYWGESPSVSGLVAAIANGRHIEGSLEYLEKIAELESRLALANQRLEMIAKLAGIS
jgi:hypothetical protein